jgi:hypothetical protein
MFSELTSSFVSLLLPCACRGGVLGEIGLKPAHLKKASDALAFLLAEAARLALTDAELGDSLALIDMPDSSRTFLVASISEALPKLRATQAELMTVREEEFVDARWRLDSELASRSGNASARPHYVLQLKTTERTKVVEATPDALEHITAELDKALGELKQGHVRRVMRNVK